MKNTLLILFCLLPFLSFGQKGLFKKLEKELKKEINLPLVSKDSFDYQGNKGLVLVWGTVSKIEAITKVEICSSTKEAQKRLEMTKKVRPNSPSKINEYFDKSFTYFDKDGTYMLIGRKGKYRIDVSTSSENSGIPIIRLFDQLLN